MHRNLSLKALLFSGISFFFTTIISGQNPAAGDPPAQRTDRNFFEIQHAFNEYWAPYDVDRNGYYVEDGVRKKAGGWKQFRRWEWYWEYRVDPVSGEFPSVSAADIYQELEESGIRSSAGNWTSLGPSTSPGGYAGLGRLNCMAEQPVTGDLYAGSPSGGLWKSSDGGASWSVLTDNNAVLGVSTVVVVPTGGDDIIYIGTGDRDGGSMWALSGGQYNDNNSVGVLKSTDGGVTWLSTGLTYSTSQKETVNRLVMDPNDNDIIYAATSDGIYKTTDGGATWPVQISGSNFIDLEMHPTNSSILYASTMDYWNSPAIYKTSNGGSSWSAVATYPSTDYRIEIGVSPADATIVYGIIAQRDGGLSSIQKSVNTGSSFSQVFGSSPNMLGWYCLGSDPGGQGGYDLCIAVDPADANTVYIGGVNTWKSTNGGSAWTNNNMWTSSSTYNSCGSPVAHADKHDLVFFGSTLYESNDGGLYKTTDGGASWLHISNSMVISQIYRLSVAQTTPDEVMTGLQDNGSKLLWAGTWYDVQGGDGMECLIDYNDIDVQYGTYPYGSISRTTAHWVGGETDITPGSVGNGAWVTPFVIDPNTNTTLYAGYSDIYRTTNRGNSWTKISNINNSDDVRSLAVAPSNSNYIYAGFRNVLYRTTNGGSSWSNITGSLPVSSSYITYVSVKDDDPNTAWVSMGEYNSYGVFETTNGGSSWTNISAGLPDIPVMCVIQNKQNTSEIELYAATDLGVYVKVGSANWSSFSNGLPNVVVTELEIYYDNTVPDNSRLRAATYGRGLWESDLYSAPTAPPVADFTADDTNPLVGQTVSFTDLTTESPSSWSWSFSPSTVTYVNSTSSTSQNPDVSFDATGLYTVTLQATNSIGSDTETKTDYIDVFDCSGITSYPYTQTFDTWTTTSPAVSCTPDAAVPLPDCWTNVVGDDIDWDILSGSTGSSSTGPTSDHTGGGNYLYTEASNCFSNTGSITSPVFDLSGITDPELTFWYHMYGATMGTLSIQVSTDGGSSWSSDIWSLSGDQGNAWYEQVLSLDPYTSETDLVIRFTGATGTSWTSDIAIDDFSITGNPIPSGEDQVTAMDGGWNIMSFYVTPPSLDMIDIFQPMIDDGSLVKVTDEAGGFVQFITGVGWMNTIGDMGNTEGYYVNLASAGSLTTNGTPVAYPYDIPLLTGWNIMAYPCDVSQVAMTILQPLIDDGYLVKVVDESGGFIQFISGMGWVNTINNFDMGEGYYINVNTDCTLTMSDPGKGTTPYQPPEAVATKHFASLTGNPFRPMNIVISDIQADGFQPEEGDEIAVFDGGLQVGSMVVPAGGYEYIAMAARSDDPLTEALDGFLEGGTPVFRYWDKSENSLYTNIEITQLFGSSVFTSLGTFGADLKVGSLGQGGYSLNGGTFLGQNYPNPYNERTRIEYGIASDAHVNISVHDVSGRTLMVLQDKRLHAGTYHIDLDKSSLEAGIYYFSMEAYGSDISFRATRKMVLY